MPRQIINLQLYQVMPVYGADINFDHDPSHGFKLQNNGYRTWIFMTPSAVEARDWIDTLSNPMLPMSKPKNLFGGCNTIKLMYL